jgi:hypothetical protein
VVAPGLGAGTYCGLEVNGVVYVARAHVVCWEMAGQTGVVGKYGIVIIDAAGKVIGWL